MVSEWESDRTELSVQQNHRVYDREKLMCSRNIYYSPLFNCVRLLLALVLLSYIHTIKCDEGVKWKGKEMDEIKKYSFDIDEETIINHEKNTFIANETMKKKRQNL